MGEIAYMPKLLRSNMLLSLVVFFTACSVHTIDEKPHKNLEIPKGYSFSSEAISDRNISTFWHEEFRDKKLSSLISCAYENNFDINQSIARIKAARSTSSISSVAGNPELLFESQNTKQFMDSRTLNVIKNGLSLSWEIDLFDRLENKARSDSLEFGAKKEDLEALKLSLGSEIAASYYGAISAYETLDLLKKQTKLNENYLELVKLRFKHGIATNLEILQQKAQVAQSKSLIPPTLANIRTYENRLDVLLGQAPDSKPRVKKEILDVKIPINTGVPSDLLLFRPDLRAQLKRIVAVDADIAFAIAQRLPSVTLGAGGYYSSNFNYSEPIASFSASLLQPLFDWGARKAEVERNKALYEEQLGLFGSLYIKALEEVENAFYNEKQQKDHIKRLEHREDILQEMVEEAKLQYLQGLSDYLPVLDALVSLHELQLSLIEAKYELLLFRITLHRSLGSKAKIKREDI